MTGPLNREWVESRLVRWRERRDGEALGELLKWQRDRAYATALRILRRPADAEDAVQKAFLKLLSRTHGFEDLESFRAAVYRAVVQCALDGARSARAREKRERVMRDAQRRPEPGPEVVVEKGEAVQVLQEELMDLAHEDRALVVLCCQEGLSASAAAQALDVPRETLRRRLGKCLAGLRKRLKRRGILVASAGLVAFLHQEQAAAAPAHLCEVLDACLPGASCATVAAAPAVPPTVAAVLAMAGLAVKVKAIAAMAAATVLAGLGGVGAVVWRGESEATAPREALAAGQRETEPRRLRPALVAPADSEAPAAAPQEEPQRRNLSDFLPEPVRTSAERALPGLRLRQIERELRGAETRYELRAVAEGREYELAIRANGELLKVEEDQDDDVAAPDEDEDEPEQIALEQLPPGVREAAEAAVNGVVLTEAEKETEGGQVFYELEGSVKGIRCEFKITEDGEVIELDLKVLKDHRWPAVDDRERPQEEAGPADGAF